MISSKQFLLINFLSTIFFSSNVIAQNKFEFGANIDPLIIPFNSWTYEETGPAYYEIHGSGNITQAGTLYFRYWPFKAFGISAGVGVRSFHSSVDYELVDPINNFWSPGIERSHPFKATGWGATISALWRTDKWKARIGLGYFYLHDRQFTPSSTISTITTYVDGEIIAHIQVEEQAYWSYSAPSSHGFIQFEGQYTLFKNLYAKLGFEKTISGPLPNPYTLHITGFIPNTAPQDQVLNDFKMWDTVASFSFGVGYTLGFGKYKSNTIDTLPE